MLEKSIRAPYNETTMNTQIVEKIESIEKEFKELKTLLKEEAKKKPSKKSDVAGLWKDLDRKDVKVSVAEGLRDYRDGKVYGPFKNMEEFKASLKKDS